LALDGVSGTSSHLCISGRSESLASEIMFRDFYPIHINRAVHKSASLGLRRAFESKRLTTVRRRSSLRHPHDRLTLSPPLGRIVPTMRSPKG